MPQDRCWHQPNWSQKNWPFLHSAVSLGSTGSACSARSFVRTCREENSNVTKWIHGRYRVRDISGIYICVYYYIECLHYTVYSNIYIYYALNVYVYPRPPSTSLFHMFTGICICTTLDEVWSLIVWFEHRCFAFHPARWKKSHWYSAYFAHAQRRKLHTYT